jgi:hypothetical protein
MIKAHLLSVLVGNQGKTALTVSTVLYYYYRAVAVVDRIVAVVDRIVAVVDTVVVVVERTVVVVDTTVEDIEIHYYLYWRYCCAQQPHQFFHLHT